MGLDMYLDGRKFFWTDWKNPENNPMEDGYKLSEKILRIGYWRKHPDLHGYIVQQFAEGVDECQDIELSKDDIEDIIKATKKSKLPHTEGFFFGESRPEDADETIAILENALKWMATEEKGVSRSIVYHASW